MNPGGDVVVIGGGCIGTAIAWQCAKRQTGRVVLIDKQGLAVGGTGRSSAVVRTTYILEPVARMALASLRIFEHFADVVGGEASFRRTGLLTLVSPSDAAALQANVGMHRRIGINARMLSLAELIACEPRILISDEIGAASLEPESGYADPHGTTMAFAEAAKRLGTELQLGVTVIAIELAHGRVQAVMTSAGRLQTHTVVVAAGYRSRELIAPHGLDLPITPVRHTVALIQRTPTFGSPHPAFGDRVLGTYFRPEGESLTLVGAAGALEGYVDPAVEENRPATDDSVRELVRRFMHRFPQQDGAVLQSAYTGVYDCTPDLQPVLGSIEGVQGLYVAAGFSGHGFKLSPIIGELMAEKITVGRTSLVDLDTFSPDRFAEGRLLLPEHPYSG